ncbi:MULTISPECIES: sensor histidine kinase [unclassified Streptomyces]|uniref:sensor histidine kinase n=1 Tax=unclassified Streptomyces TaxID=2593676 RepID=UPI000DAC2305|nr:MULTISPECIES: ATP-binding protein [unclassified Streptomyces]PZT75819.1 ATP-binding protein [Streptomyces sp. AC1-42W]PZT80228.1 ATP-binding protein [Streptomyces sp. AC1-42T]
MRPTSRPTALALLVTVALAAPLCAWAALAAPESARAAVAWGSGAAAVLLAAAVATAVHARVAIRRLREAHTAENGRFTAEVSRLVSASAAEAQRFTAENARVRAAAAAEAARAKDEAAAEAARLTAEGAELRSRLTAETAQLRARVSRAETERSAALTACANAAGRMQALATSMLADLREMEHRHTSEDVLTDLLHLDHRTAQAGRLADSIAVLTGARSGRRWARPIVMESVLRGAMGRISGYQRVRLHSTSDVAVAGHAAEGVMHALAELLDNAAAFSPPTAEVHVYVEEVPAGIVITVEDSGLVMSDVQLRRAERAVSAGDNDLTGLTGTRLGLAVVGRLARKHGLTVSFRPSARGGTGALMMLPQEIITRTQTRTGATGTAAPAASTPATRTPATATPGVPAPAAEPEPVHTSGTEPAAAPGDRHTAPAGQSGSGPLRSDSASDTTGNLPRFGESGLPKRSRGRTLAAAEARARAAGSARDTDAADDAASTTPAPDPKARAARFSSFRNAVRPDSPHPEGDSR